MKLFKGILCALIIIGCSVSCVQADTDTPVNPVLNEELVVQQFTNIQEIANSIDFTDAKRDTLKDNTSFRLAKSEITRLLRIPGTYPTGYFYGRFERDTKAFSTVRRTSVSEEFSEAKPGQVVEAHVDYAYEVNVYVPSKRGMFSGNNDCYVHNVTVSWTEPQSKRRREESFDVSRWIKRGSNKLISLPEIGQDVDIQVRCAAKPRRGGRTLINLQVAVPDVVDSEENPNYDVIMRLKALNALPATEQERVTFIETLQDIMASIQGVEVVEEEPVDDTEVFKLRRKLEYVKYLLGGGEEDIEQARAELDNIIAEYCEADN